MRINKYIYMDAQYDYWRVIIQSYCQKSERVYLNEPPDRRFSGVKLWLYKIHNSQKINAIVRLPFRSIWNKAYLDKKIDKELNQDDNICFIFYGTQYRLSETGMLRYLKCKYPNSKCVLYFGDRVELVTINDSKFDMEAQKQSFNIVGTYNTVDVDRYGISLFPDMPFDYSFVSDNMSIAPCDVFFVGQAKNRLDSIIDVYKKCIDHGYQCSFFITGVDSKNQYDAPGIVYNHNVSYNEVLERVKRCKCVVNILQDDVVGITLRDYEAISMNKLLITNGKGIYNHPAYASEMVISINNLDKELDKIHEYGKITWDLDHIKEPEEYFCEMDHIVWKAIG